jgi:prevent-host-death family protein
LCTLDDVAKGVPVRELRSILSDVAGRRDHLLVTRNGNPAAALISVDEHEALEETAELLSDPDARAARPARRAAFVAGRLRSDHLPGHRERSHAARGGHPPSGRRVSPRSAVRPRARRRPVERWLAAIGDDDV